MSSKKKIWHCKVGEVEDCLVPEGGDSPMRQAIKEAYFRLTGRQPNFVFSGWGAELTELERSVIETKEQKSEVKSNG